MKCLSCGKRDYKFRESYGFSICPLCGDSYCPLCGDSYNNLKNAEKRGGASK